MFESVVCSRFTKRQYKTKVVQIAVNATYTAFYFDYQRYYRLKYVSQIHTAKYLCLCKYSNFPSQKENIGQTFLLGRKVWRNLSLQKGKLDRNSTDTQMSWWRSACANCRVLTPDKQVSRGDIGIKSETIFGHSELSETRCKKTQALMGRVPRLLKNARRETRRPH